MVNTLKLEDRLEGETNFGLGRKGFSFCWKRMTSRSMLRMWFLAPTDPVDLDILTRRRK
jgi:hypothetical protein